MKVVFRIETDYWDTDMANLNNISPEALQWSQSNFGGLFSSDKRRKERIIKLAAKMKDSPGKTIPQLCDTKYEVKASYNVIKHWESTPENIQRGHVQLVKEEMKKPGTYLLIEDDSEFSWSGKDPIEGLGPIGDFREGQQGFMLHTTLAVRWNDGEEFRELKRPPLKVLGIADQQYFLRQPGKKKGQRKQGAPSAEQFKETDPWFHSIERIGEAPTAEDTRLIRVCDRRADIFEQLKWTKDFNQEYIIRSAQDRALESSLGGSSETLQSRVKSFPDLGEIQVELRGRKNTDARTACVTLSAGEVTFRPPFRKGIKKADQVPQTCNVVHVREHGNLPDGVTPIEWTLLTSLDVSSYESVRSIVRMYTARWMIEDFHKTLKSGLKAEDLQLGSADRLFAAISIMSVVATALVELREIARIDPEAPAAESNLDSIELEILSLRTNQVLLTVGDVILAIGRLGGHMNRKRDGFPGVVTLWRGWTYLKSMSEGARLFKKNNFSEKFG